MTAPQTEATTDPQGIIAALQQKLDEGLAREAALAEELAARDATFALHKTEFDERIEYQAATLDILTTMSASPGDAQPVLDLIVRHATELCNVPSATLFEYDGELVHIRSDYHSETILASSALAAYVQLFPMRPTRGSISCRAILDRQIIHVRDLRLDPELAGFARELGHRSQVSVPLIRDDLAIGVITIGALAPGGFSDSQIELLKTFVEQAAIAITSAETYRALQTRTSDLQETLEYQTATSDVLKVINRSTFDLQPVLDTLVETAVHLCNADFGNIFRRESEGYRRASSFQLTTERQEAIADRGDTHGVNRGSIVGRVVLEGGVVHVHDVASDPDYTVIDAIRLGKLRSSLGVPLMREGDPIGVITLGRHRVEPFTDRQIELVSTFADQAVIAIENTRLITEQREALEQQTATAEVLRVINASPGDLVPVFDAMLEKAMRLCEAGFGSLYTYDGDRFQSVAQRGVSAAYAAYRERHPPEQGAGLEEAIRTRRAMQATDMMAERSYLDGNPNVRAMVDLGGMRTGVVVPLCKDETVLGVISVFRQEVRPFSDKQIALLENFAAQAVIAMENARLITEQREALEQQTATAEVLQVINASPGNLVPVFDAMLEKATRLCQAEYGQLGTYGPEGFRGVAALGLPMESADALSRIGHPPPETVLGQVERTRQTVQMADIWQEQAYAKVFAVNPWLRRVHTALVVPMLKEGELIGVFNIFREEVRPFSDKQIALLENFAAQAVIAMENARLLTEQREALEQQTATAEVLQVINASPGDLAPVFEAILEKAHDLCDIAYGDLQLYDGEHLHSVAQRGLSAGFSDRLRQGYRASDSPASRPLLAGDRFTHITDAAAVDFMVFRSAVQLDGIRTVLFVPLRKDGSLLGMITSARREVRPFTDKEIALLENFAAQAVIAMENARLINEQREALEQQTATAEVLGVINASPGNLTPVFDAMLEKAMRLCGAAFGEFHSFDGERFVPVALLGLPANYAEFRLRTPPIYGPGTLAWRVREGADVLHIADLMDEEVYRHGDPQRRAMVDLGGARSGVSVALRKDGLLLGMINIYRQEVRPFSDRQIALLQGFAAQAVIAMENARLLGELRQRTADLQETLEYQTATSDVLNVISRSTFDLQPVLETVVQTSTRLCNADRAAIFRREGDLWRLAVNFGFPPAWEDYMRGQGVFSLDRFSEHVAVRAVVERCTVQIDDLAAVPGYGNRLGEQRTTLGVPLLREGEAIGTIVLARLRVEPFTDRQIELVNTFADQAVIAIENTRLLTEQREALEQQTATAEVLQVINASPGNLTPVFDAMLEKAHALCGAVMGSLVLYNGTHFRAVATLGYPQQFAEVVRQAQLPTIRTQLLISGERFVHVLDIKKDSVELDHTVVRRFAGTEIRTALWMPLRKDSNFLGFISAYRQEVQAFSDNEIALLENFAAQAVIAMENARLLTELRQRTGDLQESLEYQTATSDVLKVISRSTFNLQPVLETVVKTAAQLCNAEMALIGRHDGERWRVAANFGFPPEYEAYERAHGAMAINPNSPSVGWRAVREQRVVHIHDVTAIPDYHEASIRLAKQRTSLGVPLLREGEAVGVIMLARRRVEPFTERQIELVSTFADQAVIAIENTRLITEQREALEQQTATAEVLQVINTNPGDLTPVFDAILEKAHRICGATIGSLILYDGECLRAAATHGFAEEFADQIRRPFRPTGRYQRLIDGERFVQAMPVDAISLRQAEVSGVRSTLAVPLRKDTVFLGAITAHRTDVRPFDEKEIVLLENFASQAVIAMENARLLDEIRQRQAELRTTFDNMGDGVAMFDTDLRLAAWNRNFQRIIDLPDTLLETRPSYADYLRLLAERGEFGTTDIEAELSLRIEDTDKELRLERVQPDGRVIEVRRNAVSGGGFVLIYSDITERKRSEEEIRAARDAAETALRELRTAQANLIQAEKMASLGQLTAGIAHEIKNPLNFVNNFAELSVDLLGELKDAIAPAEPALTEKQRADIEDVSAMLTSNLEKITEHGKRADGIVKAMLEHSRGSSGERRMVDLNALIDEALNLAYHGARAQDQSFNITLEREFGEGIAPIEVNPQDITRVFLNLFSNGFYAATRRARDGGDTRFVPTLKVTTRDVGEAVEIRVRDNGTGIPADIRDKLFQPFFTTKPTGEGTGLGLSITYDIVTQQHGGNIAVDSEVGNYSEFTIQLPRNP